MSLSHPTSIPAVFLDRDGTINEECGHIKSPQDLVLLSGAASAIRCLNERQYLTVIVTNQSVIARGDCTEAGMEKIHNRLQSLIGEEGASIDRIYYCPHYPEDIPGGRQELKIVCDCRKPKPGLIMRAAKEMNIDLNLSWMVGDMISDIEAANRAGIRSILLSKKGNGFDNKSSVIPDAQCLDLKDAVKLITKKD